MKFSFNKSFFYKICIIFFVFHSITISTIRDSETPPLSFKKIAQNLTAIQKIALEHRYDCQYLDILCHKITQGMMPSDEIIDKGFNEACECLDSYKHTISRAQLEQLATNLEADYQLLLTNENTPPITRADLVRFHNIRVHQNANMGNAYVSNNITINNDLFVHNNETIGGDLTVGGDTVILGNTTIDGNTTINGNIILSGTVLSPSQGVFTNGLSVTGPTNINTTTAAPTNIGTGGGTTTIGSTRSTNTIQGTTDFTGSTVMSSPTGVVLTVSGNAANPAVFIQGNNTTLAPALKLCGNPPAYAGNYILQIDPTTCVVTQGTISTGTAGGINSLFGNTGAASGYQVSVVGGSNITTSGDDLSTLTVFLNPSISIPGSISAGTTITATGLTVSSFCNGVVVSNSTGILSSSAGTVGQVLTSNGPGATPTFKPAAATGISTLTTDTGSATGSSVTIHGGSNISTIATGTYVTINLINNPTLSGLLTANAGATVAGLTNINTGLSGSITTIGNTATPSTTNIFGSTNINTTATNQVTTIGATTNTTNLAGNITVNNALFGQGTATIGSLTNPNPALVVIGQSTTTAPALKLTGNPTAYAGNLVLQIDPLTGVVTQGTINTGSSNGISNGGQAGPLTIGTTNATSLSFITNNSPGLTIGANGNVSIPNTATLGGLDVLGTATVNGLLYQLGNTVSPNNVLYVQKGPLTAPNQFNSINAALATITTNSANNPFAIVVAPGIYTETTITMKQYVSLIGNDPRTSIVQTASATQNLIVPAPNSTIGNLTLQGAGAGLPGSGYAAISYAATGKVYVNNCYFGANDVLLNQVTAAPNCIITLFNCEVAPSSNFSIGFNTQSIGGVKVVLNIEKLVWGQTTSNPNFVNFINAIGAGTLVTILDTIVLPTVLLNGNFLNIVNATTATVFSSLVTNFARGIYVPNSGATGTTLQIDSVNIVGNTVDLQIDHPLTTGAVDGIFDTGSPTVVINPAITGLSVLLQDNSGGGITMLGPIVTGTTIASVTNVSPLLSYESDIGVIDGGSLSGNIPLSDGVLTGLSSSFTVTAAAGDGYLMVGTAPNDNLQFTTWPQQTITLANRNSDNFLYINQNGTLQSALSDPPALNSILLGKVRTGTAGILFIQEMPEAARHLGTELDVMIQNAFGPIYTAGSIVTQTAAGGLALSVSPGTYYYGSIQFNPSGGTALTWEAFLGSSTNTFLFNQNKVDYQHFDAGNGSLASIPAGDYARHGFYVIGDGATETYALVYSQTVYTSLVNAQAGTLPLPPSTWSGNISPIASIIVTNTTVPSQAIQQILDERPRVGFAASALTSASANVNLLPYLLLDGSRAMTGDFNVGTHNIINAGNISASGILTDAGSTMTGPTSINASGSATTSIGTGNANITNIGNNGIVNLTGSLVLSGTTNINTGSTSNTIIGNNVGSGTIALNAPTTISATTSGVALTVNGNANNPTIVATGHSFTTAPALKLFGNPTATTGNLVLQIDPASGAVTQGPAASTGFILNGGQAGPLTIGTTNATPLSFITNGVNNLSISSNGLVSANALDVINSATVNGLLYQLGNTVSPNNILYVQKGAITAPNQFNTITSALNAITDNSSTNLYEIQIAPGTYIEPTLVMKPYVNITGASQETCIIQPTSSAQNIIIGAANSSLKQVQLVGATSSGFAAVVYNATGEMHLWNCTFGSNDILINQSAGAPGSFIILIDTEIIPTAAFTTGFLITPAVAGMPAGCLVQGLLWGPFSASITDFVNVSGSGAFFYGANFSVGSSEARVGATFLNASSGALVRAASLSLSGFDAAIYTPLGVAPGPNITIWSTSTSNNTLDLNIQNPFTIGSISGTIDTINKVSINPLVSGLALLTTEPVGGGVTMLGPIFTSTLFANITNISPEISYESEIGVLDGGVISGSLPESGGAYTGAVLSFTASVTSGEGYLMTGVAPNDALKYVQWPAQNILLPGQNTDNYLYIDSTGTLRSTQGLPSLDQTIQLGKVRTGTAGIVFIQEQDKDARHMATKIEQMLENVFGPLYVSGSVVTQDGALQLDVSAGEYYFGNHQYTPTGGTAIAWEAFLGGTTNAFYADQNMVDYQNYDAGNGALAPIPLGEYAKHELFVIGDGATETYALVYSQTLFSSLIFAVEGANPTQPTTWNGNIAPLASIIVTNTLNPAAGLVQIIDQRPFPSSSFNATSGSAGGNFNGLIYLTLDGTRVMSGHLQMGNNDITNAANITANALLTVGGGANINGQSNINIAGANPTSIGNNLSTTLITGVANINTGGSNTTTIGNNAGPSVTAVVGTTNINTAGSNGTTTIGNAASTTSLVGPIAINTTPSSSTTTIGNSAQPSTNVIAGTTNINTSGTRTTTIGNGGNATNLAGTVGILGATNINTTSNATTAIGNTASTTDVNGTVNINSSPSTGMTSIGNNSSTAAFTGPVTMVASTSSPLSVTGNAVTPAVTITGQTSTTAPALQLFGNPASAATDYFLTIDQNNGIVKQGAAQFGSLVVNGGQLGTVTVGTLDGSSLNLITNGANRIVINGAGLTTINNGLTVSNGITANGFGSGVVQSNGSGVLSSVGTTNNAVQIGNGSGTLTSVPVGATNTVLLGNTGAAPTFGQVANAALVSSTIVLNSGTNIAVTGSPVSLGGAATISLVNSPSIPGSLTVVGTTNSGALISDSTITGTSISVVEANISDTTTTNNLIVNGTATIANLSLPATLTLNNLVITGTITSGNLNSTNATIATATIYNLTTNFEQANNLLVTGTTTTGSLVSNSSITANTLAVANGATVGSLTTAGNIAGGSLNISGNAQTSNLVVTGTTNSGALISDSTITGTSVSVVNANVSGLTNTNNLNVSGTATIANINLPSTLTLANLVVTGTTTTGNLNSTNATIATATINNLTTNFAQANNLLVTGTTTTGSLLSNSSITANTLAVANGATVGSLTTAGNIAGGSLNISGNAQTSNLVVTGTTNSGALISDSTITGTSVSVVNANVSGLTNTNNLNVSGTATIANINLPSTLTLANLVVTGTTTTGNFNASNATIATATINNLTTNFAQANNLLVTGTATAGSLISNSSITGNTLALVNGATVGSLTTAGNIAGGSLNVSGNAQLSNLVVTGTTNSGALISDSTITGTSVSVVNANVSGLTNTNNLNVSGTATIANINLPSTLTLANLVVTGTTTTGNLNATNATIATATINNLTTNFEQANNLLVTGTTTTGSLVSNSSITANTLAVANGATVGSLTTAGNIAGGSLNISGNAQTSNLVVTGTTNSGALISDSTITGTSVSVVNANVSGLTSTNNLNVSGTATIANINLPSTLTLANLVVTGTTTTGNLNSTNATIATATINNLTTNFEQANNLLVTGTTTTGSLVSNSSITANTLAVVNGATVGSLTTAGTIAGGSLNISGNAQTSNLVVTGTTNSGALISDSTITGTSVSVVNANVSGLTNTNNLNVSGTATIANINLPSTLTLANLVVTGTTTTGNFNTTNATIATATINNLTINFAQANNLLVTGTSNIGNLVANNATIGSCASTNSIAGTTTINTGCATPTTIGNATSTTTITGPTNINTTGAAITQIGTGGTGAVNLGNTTGTTIITGSVGITPGIGQVALTANGSTTNAAIVAIGHSLTTAPALRLLNNPASASSDFLLTIDSAGNVKQSTSTAAFGNLIYNGGQTGPLTIGTTNATSLSLITNGTSRLAIDQFGNVTIPGALTTSGLDVLGTATVNGLFYQLGNTVSPNNVLFVQKGQITAPNQFNSINAAMNSISGSSTTNPFVILVGPGIYTETTITMQPSVSLIGESPAASFIVTATGNQDLIVGASNAYIANLVLTNPYSIQGSGNSLINYSAAGNMTVESCSLVSGDVLVNQTTANSGSILSLIDTFIDPSSAFSTGINTVSVGGATGVRLYLSRTRWVPNSNPNLVNFINLQGQGVVCNIENLIAAIQNGPQTGNCLNISNANTVNANNINISGFTKAIYIPNITGPGTNIEINGAITDTNITDIQIDQPYAFGSIDGSFAASKTIINPQIQDISLLLLSPNSGGITTLGPIVTGTTVASLTNISPLISYEADIGVIDGGTLSGNIPLSDGKLTGLSSSFTVTAAAGDGYLMLGTAPNDTLQYTTWPQQAITLSGQNTDNFLYINNAGTLQSALSAPPVLSNILLGKVRTGTAGVLFIQEMPDAARHLGTELDVMIQNAFGPIYTSGSIVTQTATGSLQLSVSPGVYYYGSDMYSPTGGNALTWEAFLGSTTNTFLTNQNTVDYQHFDAGNGTLATIPAGDYARHGFYIIGDGTTETYALVYSQTIYTSLVNAQVGTLPLPPATWSGNISPIASIIVTNTTMSSQGIQEIIDERPRVGFAASSLSAASASVNLLPYLLLDGSRAMTGDFNVGTHNIINAGNITANGFFTDGGGATIVGQANINSSGSATTSIGNGAANIVNIGNNGMVNVNGSLVLSGTTTINTLTNSTTTIGNNLGSGTIALNAPTSIAALTSGIPLSVVGNASNPTIVATGSSSTIAPALKLSGNPTATTGNLVLQIDPTSGAVTQGTASNAGFIVNGGQTGPLTIGTTNATSLAFITNSVNQLSINGSTGLVTVANGETINTGGLLVNFGGVTATNGNITATTGAVSAGTTVTAGTGLQVNSFGSGVLVSNNSGIITPTSTTNNAVQIGNTSGTLSSVPVGAANTVLLGTGAAPVFGQVANAALVSSTIVLNSGSNITITGSPVSLGGAATISLVSNPTINGSLTVTGTTNSGALISGSTITGTSVSVVNANVSGLTNTNNLNVSGTATIANINLPSTLTLANLVVTGTTTTGNFNASNATIATATINNLTTNFEQANNLLVTGTATTGSLISNSSITGNTLALVNGATVGSLTTAGNIAGGSLNVSGNAQLSNLVVTGTTNSGALISGSTITGTSIFVINANVSGLTNTNNLNVSGTATIANLSLPNTLMLNNLVVTGTTTTAKLVAVNETVTTSTISNLTAIAALANNLLVTGTTTTGSLQSNSSISATTSITANTLAVTNGATVGSLTTAGNISGGTLNISGNAQLSNLVVTGTTNSGALISGSTITGTSVSVVNANVSGLTNTNNLNVSGTATIANLSLPGTLTLSNLIVSGTTTTGNLNSTNATIATATINNLTTNFEQANNLLVTGTATAGSLVSNSSITANTLAVTNGATVGSLTTAGNIAGGTLNISGNAQLSNLVVTGTTNSGALISGSTITGTSISVVNANVSGLTNTNNLNVSGTATIANLSLPGTLTLSNLIVSGTTTTGNLNSTNATIATATINNLTTNFEQANNLLVTGTATAGSLVSNSSITANTLAVTNGATVGSLTTAGNIAGGTLNISGNAQLSNLVVTGTTNSGALISGSTITGTSVSVVNANVSGLTNTNNLNVSGTATIANLSLPGTLTLSNLIVSGTTTTGSLNSTNATIATATINNLTTNFEQANNLLVTGTATAGSLVSNSSITANTLAVTNGATVGSLTTAGNIAGGTLNIAGNGQISNLVVTGTTNSGALISGSTITGTSVSVVNANVSGLTNTNNLNVSGTATIANLTIPSLALNNLVVTGTINVGKLIASQETITTSTITNLTAPSALAYNLLVTGTAQTGNLIANNATIGSCASTNSIAGTTTINTACATPTTIGNATSTTTITGPTNINTTGAATTQIATGGTGIINLGNTTGTTIITGSVGITPGTGQVALTAYGSTTNTAIVAFGNSLTIAPALKLFGNPASALGDLALTIDPSSGVVKQGTGSSAGFIVNGGQTGPLTIGTTNPSGIAFVTGSATNTRLTIDQNGGVTIQTPAGGEQGLTIVGGGLTVTAGGLTIPANGAAITGVTTINNSGASSTSIGTGGGNTTIGANGSTNALVGTTNINTGASTSATNIGNNTGPSTTTILGPTNINVTSSATTQIGTNGGATNIGSGASTNTVQGTTSFTGATNINSSGSATTTVGNALNTTNIVGAVNINSVLSGNTTTIGTGGSPLTINGATVITVTSGIPLSVTGSTLNPNTALLVTGQFSTTAPALTLKNNPTSLSTDFLLTIDGNGVVKQGTSATPFGNLIYNGGQPGPVTIGTTGVSNNTLAFITNTLTRLTIDQNGGVAIAAPTAAEAALTVNGPAGASAVTIVGTTGQNALVTSNGTVNIGTPASTTGIALTVNGASAATAVQITGATGQNALATTVGTVTINAPTSGTALTVNGAAAAATNAVTINQSASSTTASALNIVGVNGPTGAPLSVSAGTSQNAITTSAGTVTLPAYSFTGNTNAGLYAPASNQLALVTSATARLVIDATGSVSYFTKYKTHAYLNAGQTIAAVSTPVTVVFNSVSSPGFDINGSFNTSTGTYTAPISGYYFVSVNIGVSSTTSVPSNRSFNFARNGVALSSGYDTQISWNRANAEFFLHSSELIQLNGGDALTVQFTTASGASTDTLQASHTHMDIHFFSTV